MIYSVYNSTLDRLEFLENELQQEYNQNNE